MTHVLVENRPPIYEVIGGAQAVRRIVDRFMFSTTKNDEIFTLYFLGHDVRAIKAHQFPLLSQLWDGPKMYKVPDLALAHRMIGKDPISGRRFNVRPRHYEIVGDNILSGTLLEHPPRWVIAETEKLLTATTDVVCNLGKYAGTDEENRLAAEALDKRLGHSRLG